MSDMMTQEEAMDMSNEQAVQILIPMRNMMCDQNGCPISDAVFALDKAIKALSADRPQGWIPCSERLPKGQGYYICTCKDGSKYKRATVVKWSNGWQLTGSRTYWVVVAWMPLPEPWKGADDGDQ